ncbi:MAG: sulfotransferase [Pseudomonadota bacterium]
MSAEQNSHASTRPNDFALIIGAMKSGTTSLFEVLRQHPQICGANVKEPDYFLKDQSDPESYLNLWRWQGERHKIAMEASVAYAKMPYFQGVPERIKNSNLGRFKFVYVLRDPLKRIESQVRHGIFAGWSRSLDEGIPDDALQYSRYATQLDAYLEHFDRNDFFLVTLEEFKQRPNAVLAQICEFLNVDADFQFSDAETVRNSGEFFSAPKSVAQVTQGTLGQFIAKHLLPAGLKNWLRRLLTKIGQRSVSTDDKERWRLSPAERSQVLDFLADDLKRLETEFGVDIGSRWSLNQSLQGEAE